MKGCVGNLECGERERQHFASPVWQSRSGFMPVWALCPRGGSVWLALTSIERRTDSNRETETQVRLWGVSETDWQKRFSLHLHMKWSGWGTGGWKTAGKNEEKG